MIAFLEDKSYALRQPKASKEGLTVTEKNSTHLVDIAHVRRLHESAIIIDGSTVTDQTDGHIERARRGGLTAINHTVTTPYASTIDALREVNVARRWIEQNSDDVMLALTVADVHEAKASKREAIIFGPQDTEMIGADLDLLGTFYDLGVRVLQLTYQRQNLIGSGCGESVDTGVSDFGKSFIRSMNELGILIDVSHSGERTGLDAMQISSKPVVVTHAFCSQITPHIRGKSDEFIRELAANGGVMGITSLSAFLAYPDEPTRRPDLKRFVENVSRVVDIAGIDAVAVATDYDETLTLEMRQASEHTAILGSWPWDERRAIGLDDAGDFMNFTQALLEGGFNEDEVVKIMGQNWLRVFDQVWR